MNEAELHLVRNLVRELLDPVRKVLREHDERLTRIEKLARYVPPAADEAPG